MSTHLHVDDYALRRADHGGLSRSCLPPASRHGPGRIAGSSVVRDRHIRPTCKLAGRADIWHGRAASIIRACLSMADAIAAEITSEVSVASPCYSLDHSQALRDVALEPLGADLQLHLGAGLTMCKRETIASGQRTPPSYARLVAGGAGPWTN